MQATASPVTFEAVAMTPDQIFFQLNYALSYEDWFHLLSFVRTQALMQTCKRCH